MKFSLNVILSLCAVLPSNSRLLSKTTVTATTNNTNAKSISIMRHTRATFNEPEMLHISEDDNHSNGFVNNSNTDFKIESKVSLKSKSSPSWNLPRIARYSSENNNTQTSTNITEIIKPSTQPEIVFVKKPVSKLNEIHYDDNFKNKVVRSARFVGDSGEHEDEDFNLDDYDFDINHDEFSGRGKPLVPIVKNKGRFEQQILDQTDQEIIYQTSKPVPLPVMKTQNKVTPLVEKSLSKRNHDGSNYRKTTKVSEKQEDDYDEDVSSAQMPPDNKAHAAVEESDENEDSTEEKTSRNIRSSRGSNRFMDKLGEKTASYLYKFMHVLPMFPLTSRFSNHDNGELSDRLN